MSALPIRALDKKIIFEVISQALMYLRGVCVTSFDTPLQM